MQNFKYILLASAVTFGGCTTTLEHRTPIDIASNSVRITYPENDVNEILAPPVETFTELRAKVKGMAQLRTAGPFTDAEGAISEGGAYLDVLINYKSASPNPLETRQYSQAYWPGGEAAQLADFGTSVLDCRSDVRNVRRFPLGSGYGGYGYGYGNYGYGNYGYGGYGHSSRRRHNRPARHGSNDSINDHTDHNLHTNHNQHTNDNLHDGSASAERMGGNNIVGGSIARPELPNVPGQDHAKKSTSKRAVSRPRPELAARSAPNVASTSNAALGHTSAPATNSAHSSSSGRSSLERSHATTRQHRNSRPQSNSTHSSTRSLSSGSSRSHNSGSSSSRSHSSGSSSSRGHSSGRSSSSSSSSSSHSSGSGHSRSARHLNYYPTDPFYNPGYIDTVVRRYCERQENLRVFVPRERLEQAKLGGLNLLIRPRGGREEVLDLPPNYISGFMLAAWTPEGQKMTIPVRALPRQITPQAEQEQEAQTQTNAPKAKTPKPDPTQPIIYGDN
jgi:hypothetical protein